MKSLNELSGKFFNTLSDQSIISKSDLTCFKKSLEQFLASGSKEDAFTVYFCFSEIFMLFGNGYDNTDKLLELLSDHEHHSGELLSKHRDHYSHSVYVFSLGLAIYVHDLTFRNAFNKFYGYKDTSSAALSFLKHWGLTSLFHDIGYPFQLAHEQIKNYSQELWGKDAKQVPYVSFGNIKPFTAIDEETASVIQKNLSAEKRFSSIDELLAYGLKLREGYDEAVVCDLLRRRIEVQPAFMDHGYFSAVVLSKKIINHEACFINIEILDVLTAILLHNNFNKYDMPNAHRIDLTEHPLSYLLILCDELQNWDRLAYGKISKRDPIAWDITLDIRKNEISAVYLFDSCTVTDENNKKRINKSFAEIQDGIFVDKIKKYITSPLTLAAAAEVKEKNKKKTVYASDNNFINLCDFAKAIHISYLDYCKDLDADSINKSFEELPLEFKVSNIEQAKSYAYKLELINCFYSSKDLDYPVVEDFSSANIGSVGSDNLGFLCREEHVRWVREKLNLGWMYGTNYSTKEERNAKKIHKDIVPFEELSESEQKKDEIMINNIIPLLKKFGNNIRIYNYRIGRKPDLEIAGLGHRYFIDNKEKLKERIKSILLKYSETNHVIVRTCFAYGADQLIAECANELGLTTKATLPLPYEDFIKDVRRDAELNQIDYSDEDEIRLRHLLAQTVVCKSILDPEYKYANASKYLIDKCEKLIVLWDGEDTPLSEGNKTAINQGGTFHCYQMALARGMKDGDDIHIIRCHRR